MNKKFFTLIAGLLLAVCGTINAQVVASPVWALNPSTSYQQDGYYLLGNGTDFIAVENPSTGVYNYSIVAAPTAATNFKSLSAALWRVNIVKPAGSPDVKYTFTNRLTGVVLSADAASAFNSSTNNISGVLATIANSMPIGGNVTEWNNTTAASISAAAPMTYYFNNTGIAGKDSVAYLSIATNTTTSVKYLVACKEAAATPQTFPMAAAMQVRPYGVNYVNLTAEDLNTELYSVNNGTSFQTSFSPTVSTGFLNQFTDTRLTATDVPPAAGSTLTLGNYVTLNVKDNTDKYVVVDTAYHVGTEQVGQLIKVTTDGFGADRRNPGSYNFAFQYYPTNDSIAIQVQSFYRKQATQSVAGLTQYSYWWAGAAPTAPVTDAAVRIAILYGTQVLTFANRTNYDALPVGVNFYGEVDQNTMVRIGYSNPNINYTTIANGIYLIQYKTDKTFATGQRNNGDYLIKNLAGLSGWTKQEVQDFHNMPAAQWVVTQNNPGTPYSAISICNREFNDIPNGGAGQYTYFPQGIQAYSVDGNNKNVYCYYSYNNVSYTDTLSFIPVRDQVTKTIGYKYVQQDSVLVEKYLLSYLNALAMGKYVTTNSGKDSLVRVDPNDGKMTFQLEYAAQNDYYGFDSLKRNAYYIRVKDASKLHFDNRCIVFDPVLKKYIISEKHRQAFFIKENNFKNGTHFYALVEAQVADSVAAPGTNTTYCDSNGNIYANGAMMPVYRNVTENGKTYARATGIVLDNVTSRTVLNGLYVYNKVGNNVVKVSLTDYFGVVAPAAASNFATLSAYAGGANNLESTDYSTEYKVSVEDATANMTQGSWNNVFQGSTEIRTSAFSVEVDDAPLYRRFNANANGKETGETFGNAANSPLYLKFQKFNDKRVYLGVNSPATQIEPESGVGRYRTGLVDKSINFLGMFDAGSDPESAKMSYTLFVDTAYVRNNTIMPQYLIGFNNTIQKADTVWCGEDHATLADSLACQHTKITQGFTRAMWLFNAHDSARVAGNEDYLGKAYYATQDQLRLAFVDGIHARDTFYVLRGANSLVANENINLDRMNIAAADKHYLGNNKHKNMVFSFRLIDEKNRRFVIESYSGRLNGKKHDLTTDEGIAPRNGGWVQLLNSVPVMTYSDLKTAIDGKADIFDVTGGVENNAVSNEDVKTTGVEVIAANGSVIVKGAAGKQVVISNILGQTIANRVLTSDNEPISTPQGVVIVSVAGEKAVKAMVK